MEYLHKWFDDLARPGAAWEQTGSARGECRRHVGPSIWYAAVEIRVSPNDKFEVEDLSVPRIINRHIDGERWYDQIVFGVLDVMLTRAVAPIKSFKLTILEIDFDEIQSTPMAFRLAARDAALKILNLHNSSGPD